MKANELSCRDLMVGDWVRIKITQYNTTVTNIDANSVYTEAAFPIRYDEIEPISLTPKILEKNGFSADYCNDDLSYAQSCGDVIGIHISGKNGLMDEMYFKYVHQLQHALKLCEIDKTIEL